MQICFNSKFGADLLRYFLCYIFLRTILGKTNISYPLIRTRTCAYQGVKNVSFSEDFAYVLNE